MTGGYVTEQGELWALLRSLLVAVAEDLEECLQSDTNAALQPLRARLLLKNIDEFAQKLPSVSGIDLPALNCQGKTPAAQAQSEILKFVAIIDNNVVN